MHETLFMNFYFLIFKNNKLMSGILLRLLFRFGKRQSIDYKNNLVGKSPFYIHIYMTRAFRTGEAFDKASLFVHPSFYLYLIYF